MKRSLHLSLFAPCNHVPYYWAEAGLGNLAPVLGPVHRMLGQESPRALFYGSERGLLFRACSRCQRKTEPQEIHPWSPLLLSDIVCWWHWNGLHESETLSSPLKLTGPSVKRGTSLWRDIWIWGASFSFRRDPGHPILQWVSIPLLEQKVLQILSSSWQRWRYRNWACVPRNYLLTFKFVLKRAVG